MFGTLELELGEAEDERNGLEGANGTDLGCKSSLWLQLASENSWKVPSDILDLSLESWK